MTDGAGLGAILGGLAALLTACTATMPKWVAWWEERAYRRTKAALVPRVAQDAVAAKDSESAVKDRILMQQAETIGQLRERLRVCEETVERRWEFGQ